MIIWRLMTASLLLGLNQPLFKLSQRREDIEDDIARGGRRIDYPVAERTKADLFMEQIFNKAISPAGQS